jgi:hypothetical protein
MSSKLNPFLRASLEFPSGGTLTLPTVFEREDDAVERRVGEELVGRKCDRWLAQNWELKY